MCIKTWLFLLFSVQIIIETIILRTQCAVVVWTLDPRHENHEKMITLSILNCQGYAPFLSLHGWLQEIKIIFASQSSSCSYTQLRVWCRGFHTDVHMTDCTLVLYSLVGSPQSWENSRFPLFYPVIKRSSIDVEILQLYKYTFSKISKYKLLKFSDKSLTQYR